jgi:hypothetical protein
MGNIGFHRNPIKDLQRFYVGFIVDIFLIGKKSTKTVFSKYSYFWKICEENLKKCSTIFFIKFFWVQFFLQIFLIQFQ